MPALITSLAWVPGPLELGVILVVALLVFGRRLPDVARSMGKSIVEFKKGLKGVEDDVNHALPNDNNRQALPDESSDDAASR